MVLTSVVHVRFRDEVPREEVSPSPDLEAGQTVSIIYVELPTFTRFVDAIDFNTGKAKNITIEH